MPLFGHSIDLLQRVITGSMVLVGIALIIECVIWFMMGTIGRVLYPPDGYYWEGTVPS